MSVAAMIFQAIAGVLLLLAPTLAQAQSFKVTLLGTGSPAPVIDRFGPSILVEAGTEKLLFDCGRGAAQRIYQLKMPLGTVNTLFLTHLHSDHVVGIPDLWLTGWTTAGRREVPFRVWGPRGTTEMMSHLDQAYRFDIRIRLYDTRPSPEGVLMRRARHHRGRCVRTERSEGDRVRCRSQSGQAGVWVPNRLRGSVRGFFPEILAPRKTWFGSRRERHC